MNLTKKSYIIWGISIICVILGIVLINYIILYFIFMGASAILSVIALSIHVSDIKMVKEFIGNTVMGEKD